MEFDIDFWIWHSNTSIVSSKLSRSSFGRSYVKKRIFWWNSSNLWKDQPDLNTNFKNWFPSILKEFTIDFWICQSNVILVSSELNRSTFEHSFSQIWFLLCECLKLKIRKDTPRTSSIDVARRLYTWHGVYQCCQKGWCAPAVFFKYMVTQRPRDVFTRATDFKRLWWYDFIASPYIKTPTNNFHFVYKECCGEIRRWESLRISNCQLV